MRHAAITLTQADIETRKEAHDALYAKAQPMFTEMRAAFAAQAK